MLLALEDVLADLRGRMLDESRLVRAVASGRRRGERPRWRKAELRPVRLKRGDELQLTTFDDTQSFTRNLTWGLAAAEAVEELLALPFGNWLVETVDESVQVRITKSGRAQVHRAKRSPVDLAEIDRRHDRAKERMVDLSAPFLRALGVTDDSGAVRARRRDKYEQVEAFVRALDPVLPTPAAAVQRVVDLGCGNAYLTFVTYATLSRSHPQVDLLGVDVKRQAREHNEAVAEQLGLASHISFVDAAITDVSLPWSQPPDLVTALHACDTATDDALTRAVRWRAPVVVAAPCCHHDLQRRVARARPLSPPIAPLLRYGALRERELDVVTDAWRALILRLLGYRVEVVEFVASRHTPRNVLIRATYTRARVDGSLWTEHDALAEQWQCLPYLADMLADEIAAARARTLDESQPSRSTT